MGAERADGFPELFFLSQTDIFYGFAKVVIFAKTSCFFFSVLISRTQIAPKFSNISGLSYRCSPANNFHQLILLRRLERVFTSRGDWFRVNATAITGRAKSNKPEMKSASLLSIYLKNLLGDLR